MNKRQENEKIKLIHFFFEDVQFDFFLPESRLAQWITTIIHQYKCELVQLNFIFCSDEYLRDINISYLSHDTYTDIITFPYASLPKIEGDIFISYDRIRENAQKFEVSDADELHRVIIHGVLHLCGLGDKSEAEALKMRNAEDEALSLL